MADTYPVPDQSYFDWLKQVLGANLPSQQTLQDYGILPKGIATTPATQAKDQVVGPGIVTADPNTTGMYGVQNALGLPNGLKLPMQKRDTSNPAEYVANNADPFAAPPDWAKVATRPDIPVSKNNRIAGLQSEVMTRPETPVSDNNRVAGLQTQVMSRPDVPAIPNPNYSSPVPSDPRLAFASPQFQSMIAARPDVPPQFQSMIAGRPDAVGQNVFNTPQVPSLFAAKPDAVGSNTFNAPAALPPQTSAVPIAAGPQAPAADPTANYINSGLFGMGPKVDPNAINPATGLTNAQTQMMQYNMLGSVGAKLLAAGQNIMPAQRAQILGELGTAANEPMNMMTQMQQRLLQNNKLARENAIHTNLVAAFRSPEVQKEISSWTPDNQALAKAAIQAGDDETLKTLWEKNQIRALSDGSIFDPKSGTVTSQFSGTTRLPGYGNTSAQSSAQDTSNLSGDDLLKALPENQQALYNQLLSGNMSLNEVLSRAPFQTRAAITGTLQRIDPEANLDARRQIGLGFSKTGPNDLGTLRTSIGTSFAHGNELLKSFEDNKNSNVPLINSLTNEWSKISGYAGAPTINTAVRGFATETMRAMKGGMPNEGEINALVGDLPANASPQQARSVIDRITAMARQRAEETEGNIKSNMGRFMRPNLSMFTPDVQKRIEDYNSNPFGKPKAAAAPQPGKYKWNPQTGQMEPM
jgi:hypothetical protein